MRNGSLAFTCATPFEADTVYVLASISFGLMKIASRTSVEAVTQLCECDGSIPSFKTLMFFEVGLILLVSLSLGS